MNESSQNKGANAGQKPETEQKSAENKTHPDTSANPLAVLYDGGEPDISNLSDDLQDVASEAARIQDVEQRRLLLDKAAQDDPQIMAALAEDTNQQVRREYTETDTGNAQRLVDMFGCDIRYVHEARSWYHFTGNRWKEDTTNHVLGLTAQVAERIREESFAITPADDADRKRQETLLKWANRSLEEKRRKAMPNLAAAESGMTVSLHTFDTDPYLLNVQNGTFDLRSGQLRQRQRDDFITHCLPAPYKSQATCPRWQQFLREIFNNDEDLIHFIRKAIGYALSGDISEQCLFILYGTGGNGKSIFLDVLRMLLGPLSLHTPIETFTVRDTNKIPEDRARLRGARFVTTSETGYGHTLDESFVKDMTGGDPIAARFLKQNSFEFYPEFKVFLACNHKPRITGTDEGIWRRLRVIPFTQRFKGENCDPNIFQKLEQELPGILCWAVEGCQRWLEEGLSTAKAVEKATSEYRNESDVLGDFFDECCEIAPELSASVTEVYQTYEQWARAAGHRPLSKSKLSVALKERGFQNEKSTGGQRRWQGFGLRSQWR